MATGRPKIFDHDVRLKMPHELHLRLRAAASKLRRTVPDFIRLILENAVMKRKLPPGFTLSKTKLPGWTKE